MILYFLHNWRHLGKSILSILTFKISWKVSESLSSSSSPLECDETVNTLCDLYSFGWWRFIQGIHLTSIREVQQQYFDDANPSKSISFWHGRIIRALWEFLCDLHEDRRKFLVQRRMDLEPINPAARAARKIALRELLLGKATTRPFYHHLFHLHTKELCKKNVSALRSWLRDVRFARENDSSHCQTADDFSPSGKYRAWLLRHWHCIFDPIHYTSWLGCGVLH